MFRKFVWSPELGSQTISQLFIHFRFCPNFLTSNGYRILVLPVVIHAFSVAVKYVFYHPLYIAEDCYHDFIRYSNYFLRVRIILGLASKCDSVFYGYVRKTSLTKKSVLVFKSKYRNKVTVECLRYVNL